VTNAPAPLRTLIVDDEPLAVERLTTLASQNGNIALVGHASDGAAALRMIGALAPDLILCDIAMPGLSGIDVARSLADMDRAPAVVFVTAFDQYAVAAFDVEAVDYLLKPVAPERLERAVARVHDAMRNDEATSGAMPRRSPWIREFWVQHRAEMLRIDAGSVDLIEAERDYMRLHVAGRSWLIHQTIKELEARLDPAAFLRIHRSKIVRRAGICALRHNGDGAWSVDLGEGGVHRIGRTYLHDVKAIMQQ
jgi:two-component system response regulator AlgR